MKVFTTKLKKYPSKHINVETTLIVNVHQRCINVDIWLKMKVELTHVYRRCLNIWQNNVERTLTELRRFKVDYPMFFQRTIKVSWKWNLSQHMFISVALTLREQLLNNFITLVLLMFTRKWLKNKTKLMF